MLSFSEISNSFGKEIEGDAEKLVLRFLAGNKSPDFPREIFQTPDIRTHTDVEDIRMLAQSFYLLVLKRATFHDMPTEAYRQVVPATELGVLYYFCKERGIEFKIKPGIELDSIMVAARYAHGHVYAQTYCEWNKQLLNTFAMQMIATQLGYRSDLQEYVGIGKEYLHDWCKIYNNTSRER